ncbi:C-type lection lectoxin-Enh3-like [Danio rerio]|uniref:C-type lection lectoxin-Enh3-like n=1 Tax=Danio rerio TaxID=7955 RepID=A0AC58G2M6_DANRE
MMRNCSLLMLFSALVYCASSRLHEFINVPEPMNWTNAQTYCRRRYTDLPTIDDQTDHKNLLDVAGMGKFWLGFSRTSLSRPFEWSDQSSSSFRLWKAGQPNGQLCVNVESGFWFDRNCVDLVPFACYIDRKKQVVRLEVNSSQSLNDPGETTRILAKMEQMLKQKGLSEYATLSWRARSDGIVFQTEEQKRNAVK